MDGVEIGTFSPGGGNTAGELISRGDQMLQIRTKNQLMVAVQRPRDIERFRTKLVAMAAQAAEDFYYLIEFKNHKRGCSRKGCDCPNTDKPVQGPGVGLARSAAPLYTNCSVEADVDDETDTHWNIRGHFTDFENNFSRSVPKRISKPAAFRERRDGSKYPVSEKEFERELAAGLAKVERDVILGALPQHIIDEAYETAKAAAMAGKAPVAQQVERLAAKFGEIGVTVPMIESHIGCPFSEPGLKIADKSGTRVCAELRGLLTALRGGEITVEQIFGRAEPAPETDNTGAGTASAPPVADTAGGATDSAPPEAPPPSSAPSAPALGPKLQNSTKQILTRVAIETSCKVPVAVPKPGGGSDIRDGVQLDESLAALIGMPGVTAVAIATLTDDQGKALVNALQARRATDDAAGLFAPSGGQ